MTHRHPSDKPSPKAIYTSLICHVVVIILVILIPNTKLFFRDKPMKVIWVNIPAGSSENINIGLKETKTLPRTTIPEQKKPSRKKPQKRMTVASKKKRKSAADRRIEKALAKIDKDIKTESGKRPEAAQIKSEGEGFKYGTGNEALRVAPDNPEYLKYQSMVRAAIIKEWIIPLKFLEDESIELNSRLEVMIDTNGEVISIQWDKTSGNQSFDSSAIRAIKKASPFPKPPSKLAWEAYNEGFLVEFDPRLKR